MCDLVAGRELLKPVKHKPLPVGLQTHPMVAFSTPPPPLLDQKLNHLSSKLPALLMQMNHNTNNYVHTSYSRFPSTKWMILAHKIYAKMHSTFPT
jgi:hypothetical protein